MSDLHNDQDEAQALSDTINGMPTMDDEDDVNTHSPLFVQDKPKKKTALKLILGSGVILLVCLGGFIYYSQTMAKPKFKPQAHKQMPLGESSGANSVKSAGVSPEVKAMPVFDTPKLTSDPHVEAPAQLPAPLDKKESKAETNPFDTPKSSGIPEGGQRPLKTTVLNTEPVKSSTSNVLEALAPNEKLVEPKTASTKPTKPAGKMKISQATPDSKGAVLVAHPPKTSLHKKTPKNLTKKHVENKPVLRLPNEQPIDNGYNVLF